MGSDWLDHKNSTLRVRPCISSNEELCVFFGDLVVPEAAAVAMLIKAQKVELSAPFLDLHAGHVIPDRADSWFLGEVTVEDICAVAHASGFPLTKDQYNIAKTVVGFEYGLCCINGPGGCGKTILLASCILSRMKYLRGNQKIAFLFPKNDMKFAAVRYLRRCLTQMQPDANVFQIASFGKSSSDFNSESSEILDFEAERHMRVALKVYIDEMEEAIAELDKNAGGTVLGSQSWLEYKALAGKVLTLKAQYLIARGSLLQKMFREVKVFCGTFDSFNTTSVGRNQ